MSTIDRVSWPRDRRADGTPIVGWTCDNCGHEVEAPYKPSRLARCPNCGAVVRDDVLMDFPNSAECGICESQLEKAMIAPRNGRITEGGFNA